MSSDQVYIEKPTNDVILDAVTNRLRKITTLSGQGEIILQGEGEYNAHVSIVVPQSCPACLYDTNAPLDDNWALATRDELMVNLPTAWLQFETRLVIEIIDLILELGMGSTHRFMKSLTSDGIIYWITSARMICFFHQIRKTEE